MLSPADRRVPLAAATLCLALVPVALAAKPKPRAHFKGSITAASARLEGFKPPVTFTVGPTGRSAKSFTFGSPGCEGVGGLQPGKNPFRGSFLVHAGTLKVSSKGRISTTKTVKTKIHGGSGTRVETTTETTKVTVKARFPSPKKVTGTIAIAQSFKFPSQPTPQSCKGKPLKFTAQAR